MVDSVLEVQNIKLPDSGGVTSSTAITLDASGNTTATLSSSSNIKAPLNASGNAPVYACRAWVNFNGTASMTVGSSYGPDAPPADFSTPNPIRASGNVSSITDNGNGDYTVNFTNAMPDINYAPIISNSKSPNINFVGINTNTFTGTDVAPTTTTCRISFSEFGVGGKDSTYISFAVFR